MTEDREIRLYLGTAQPRDPSIPFFAYPVGDWIHLWPFGIECIRIEQQWDDGSTTRFWSYRIRRRGDD